MKNINVFLKWYLRTSSGINYINYYLGKIEINANIFAFSFSHFIIKNNFAINLLQILKKNHNFITKK